MKRFLTLFLAVLIILSGCIGVSADSKGLLKGMDVLGELVTRADTDYVRRDEFAAVAATLMGLNVQGPSATAFGDVTQDNIYGAAIRTVNEGSIMNGVNSYEFAPASTITLQEAVVAYIRLLGYEVWAKAKGGYPAGYNQVATSLKLFSHISKPLDSMLTFGDLWAITDWIMDTSVAQPSYIMQNGQLVEEIKVRSDSPTLLEQNLGLTMYEATVEEIIAETHSINVVIGDDESDRLVKYSKGDTLTLKAAPTVNIIAYDKAPVNIWITDEDELMYLEMQDNCEVIYGTVYSVNKDYSEGTSYNTASIEEIVLWDNEKEYEISGDGVSYYHNEKPFSGNIELTDKYVRIVTKDGDIVSVETWDFRPGGLIKEINFKNIVYERGDVTEAITNVEDYYKQVLILDGEVRDIKDLKTGTLVDYFISDDKETFILLASEKKHSDVFEGANDDEIQIGNLLIRLSDTVYTLSDDRGYVEGNISELMGSRISAYVDAFGKVRYITTEGEVTKSDFIGYLIGIEERSGLSSKIEAYIANLDDAEFTKKVYSVSDKVVYEDSLNQTILDTNSDTRTAKSIYRFKVNAKGEVIRVSAVSPYYGYTPNADGLVTATWSGQFPGRGDPTYYSADNDSGKRIYFPKNEKMVVLYEKDGEAAFGTTSYANLESKTPTGSVSFAFFGEEMSSEFDLILLIGDIARIKGESSGGYGIVESVRTTVDEEGEEIKLAQIDGQRYLVDNEDAAVISENTLVAYSKLTGGFSDYDIDITDYIKLSGELESWEGKTGAEGNIELKRGTISKVDSRRIFFDDGSAYFFGTSGCKYRVYDSSNGKFSDGSAQDFLQGRDVIYLLTSSQTISTVFYTN